MKLKKTTVAASIAAVTVALGAQAAFASTTLSVDGSTTPPADIRVDGTTGLPGASGYLGKIQFETDYAVPADCDNGDSSGYVKRGISGGIGTKVGAIDAMSFQNCSATALGFLVHAFKKATPAEWPIVLDESPAKGQRYIKVEIQGVSAQMNNRPPATSLTCALSAVGTVKATIDTAAPGGDQLIVNTPALTGAALKYPLAVTPLNLAGTAPAASSCGGEVQTGDKASMKGIFRLNRDLAVS